MSVYKEMEVTVKIALLPQELGDIISAIRKKMDAMLFTYSFELQAVPLMFSDLKFDGQSVGKVIAEIPWIHIDVETKVLVFCPVTGGVVQGKVNQVSYYEFLILTVVII